MDLGSQVKDYGRAKDVSRPLVHIKTATPEFALEFTLG